MTQIDAPSASDCICCAAHSQPAWDISCVGRRFPPSRQKGLSSPPCVPTRAPPVRRPQAVVQTCQNASVYALFRLPSPYETLPCWEHVLVWLRIPVPLQALLLWSWFSPWSLLQ